MWVEGCATNKKIVNIIFKEALAARRDATTIGRRGGHASRYMPQILPTTALSSQEGSLRIS